MRQTRRSWLINELSRLSRGGWDKSKPEEYQALERELGQLLVKRSRKARRLRRVRGWALHLGL